MDHVPPPPPPPVPQLPDSLAAPELTEVPWRAREGFLIAILTFVTGGFFALFLIAIVNPRPGALGDEQRNHLGLYVQMIFLAALGFWTWLWVKLRHNAGLPKLGLRFGRKEIPAGLAAAGVGFVASSIVTAIVTSIYTGLTGDRVDQPEQLSSDVLRGGWLVLAGFTVMFMAPFAEELFFRGFLYQAFRRWRGVTKGILISAAVFGIAHLHPLFIVGIFPLGVVLAYVFERRGSVVPSMIGHGVFNLTAFIMLVASGN